MSEVFYNYEHGECSNFTNYRVTDIVNDEWIVCQFRENTTRDCFLRGDIAEQIGAIDRGDNTPFYTEDGVAWYWVAHWFAKKGLPVDDLHSAEGVAKWRFNVTGLEQHFI